MAPLIAASTNTTTAVGRFRYLDRQFEAKWVPSVEHDRRIVQQTGDLILTLQDLWDIEAVRNIRDFGDLVPGCSFGEFLDEDVLERWAEGWRFSLDGIASVEALHKLVYAFVLPTIAELPDRKLHKTVQKALRSGRGQEAVPTYVLQVDGAAVRHFLVDVFDGPFTSDRDLNRAMIGRTVA